MSGRQHAPAAGKDPVPIVQEAGWAQGRSGRAGNLVPTGIRSPDRPARSSVAIPTELPGPHLFRSTITNFALNHKNPHGVLLS